MLFMNNEMIETIKMDHGIKFWMIGIKSESNSTIIRNQSKYINIYEATLFVTKSVILLYNKGMRHNNVV